MSRTIWKGEHFAVRDSYDPLCTDYFLVRPRSGAVLDKFADVHEAVSVAKYCEERGRSYAAPVRKAARRHAAKLRMPVAPCPMNALEAAAPQAESARMRTEGGAA